jgi:hypothetical protein
MKYTKESKEWLQIRANNYTWFSPSSMRFFNCKVYWKSLTKADQLAKFFFITSERWSAEEPERFSIRQISHYEMDSIETVGKFCEYDSYEAAKEALEEHVAALNALIAGDFEKLKKSPYKFGDKFPSED